jgi:hypothetical protein
MKFANHVIPAYEPGSSYDIIDSTAAKSLESESKNHYNWIPDQARNDDKILKYKAVYQ